MGADLVLGLSGIALGVGVGRYLARRTGTTSWARWALAALLLASAGGALLADGGIQRAAAAVGGGIAGTILTDSLRAPSQRAHRGPVTAGRGGISTRHAAR